MKNKCRFAIAWFALWGGFQAYAVTMVILGKWKRPEAFPEQAYNLLIWPDIFFIPLYLLTAALLRRGRKEGAVLGLFSSGAVSYAMIYLFALSGFSGAVNLLADGLFLGCNTAAMIQLGRALIL